MENKGHAPSFIIGMLILAGLLLAGAFLIPWQKVNWGKFQLTPIRTITVVGEAKGQEKNQVASFTAGVSSVKDNKDEAISEVNQKIKTIIEAVKNFGIKDEDIQTQNLSVSQEEESYYDESGVRKSRPGQWRVNNSISVKLREIDRASALADLLSRSGATNVYGPNFTIDENQPAQKALLETAIDDAQEKAEIIAKSSGGQLGKIISITEGYQASPIYRFEGVGIGGGGGAPVEPGSSTISQTVTVVFEIE